MDELRLTLPLPDRRLSPNASSPGSWRARWQATRNARLFAAMKASFAVRNHGAPRWRAAEVRTTWYLPDRRRRDRTNLLASLKAALDGLTDAGVWVDDDRVDLLPPTLEVDRVNPRVELVIRPLP